MKQQDLCHQAPHTNLCHQAPHTNLILFIDDSSPSSPPLITCWGAEPCCEATVRALPVLPTLHTSPALQTGQSHVGATCHMCADWGHTCRTLAAPTQSSERGGECQRLHHTRVQPPWSDPFLLVCIASAPGVQYECRVQLQPACVSQACSRQWSDGHVLVGSCGRDALERTPCSVTPDT